MVRKVRKIRRVVLKSKFFPIRFLLPKVTIIVYSLLVCSTTLWVGHLSKLIAEDDLSDMFGEFGEILSINTIPPRGCAFICMNRRMDAYKALKQLHKTKLHGKQMTVCNLSILSNL